MTELLTLKLADDLKRQLNRAAARAGISRSAYVRTAIERALREEREPVSRIDLVRDLVGAFNSGNTDLSQRDPGPIIRAKHRRVMARYDRRTR